MLTFRAVLVRINAGTKWIVSGEELSLDMSLGAAVGKGEWLKHSSVLNMSTLTTLTIGSEPPTKRPDEKSKCMNLIGRTGTPVLQQGPSWGCSCGVATMPLAGLCWDPCLRPPTASCGRHLESILQPCSRKFQASEASTVMT